MTPLKGAIFIPKPEILENHAVCSSNSFILKGLYNPLRFCKNCLTGVECQKIVGNFFLLLTNTGPTDIENKESPSRADEWNFIHCPEKFPLCDESFI